MTDSTRIKFLAVFGLPPTVPSDFEMSFLAVNDVDHTKTKVKSTQTIGLGERFHKTVVQEFCQVAFRKRLYVSLERLQADLDAWLVTYNEQRTHQGKMCFGRTPWETFEDGRRLAEEKVIDNAA